MENKEEIIDTGMTHGPMAIQIMYKKHVFVFNFIVHCLALFPTVLLPYIQRGANDVAIVAPLTSCQGSRCASTPRAGR